MHRRLVFPAIGLLVVSSCFVGIEDTEDKGNAGAANGGAGQSGSAGQAASAGAGGVAASGGVGAAGGSAGSSGSSGTAGSGGDCLLPYQDDFEDSATAPFWTITTAGGGAIAETGGKLSATFPSTIDTFVFAGYTLQKQFDLTSCSVLVRVDEVLPNDVNAAATLSVMYSLTDYAEIIKSTDRVHFQYFYGGKQTYLGAETYSVSAHLWWRFRHAAGSLNWETSGDGKQWKQQATAALPATFSALRIGGSAYIHESGVTGGVKMDDFDILPP